MSFLDGNPHVITQELSELNWSGSKGTLRLRCKLCGHRFVVGDRFRLIYSSESDLVRCGNFFVCEDCDDDNSTLLKRMAGLEEEGFRRFWWLIDDDDYLERAST